MLSISGPSGRGKEKMTPSGKRSSKKRKHDDGQDQVKLQVSVIRQLLINRTFASPLPVLAVV